MSGVINQCVMVAFDTSPGYSDQARLSQYSVWVGCALFPDRVYVRILSIEYRQQFGFDDPDRQAYPLLELTLDLW